jgi:hypothetical protein
VNSDSTSSRSRDFSPLIFGKSQSNIQCVFEVLSPSVKWPKRGVYHLHPAPWLRKPAIYFHFPKRRHVNTGISCSLSQMAVGHLQVTYSYFFRFMVPCNIK